MKFAHYLKDVREEAPPALRDTFLDYKLLKKDLKALREAKGDGEEEKKTFFKHLEAQISDVNEKFQSCATSMIETFDKSHDRTAFMQFCDKLLCHMLTHKNDDGKSQQLMELADKAEWCRRYANINAVALRKIVKKYDKVVHSHEGHQWLQVVYARLTSPAKS